MGSANQEHYCGVGKFQVFETNLFQNPTWPSLSVYQQYHIILCDETEFYNYWSELTGFQMVLKISLYCMMK